MMRKDNGCSEMAKWDTLTTEHSSDKADTENEKDIVHVKTEKVDGVFCPKLTSYFKIGVICTNIVKMFVLCWNVLVDEGKSEVMDVRQEYESVFGDQREKSR